MQRWVGKLAVVTGASAGIGAAISKDLAKAGVTVVGLARRLDRLEQVREDINKSGGKFHSKVCDVTKDESVNEAFEWIEKNLGAVNILINNSGVTRPAMILDEGNCDNLKTVVDTNVMGVLRCTKLAYQSMKKYDDIGHIVNINSVAGHVPINFHGAVKPEYNIYPGSKYAITATTEVIRQELNFLQNRKVKITSVSPGLVATEIFEASGMDVKASGLDQMPILKSEDIAACVLSVIGTPPHVQIHEVIIKPVGEVF